MAGRLSAELDLSLFYEGILDTTPPRNPRVSPSSSPECLFVYVSALCYFLAAGRPPTILVFPAWFGQWLCSCIEHRGGGGCCFCVSMFGPVSVPQGVGSSLFLPWLGVRRQGLLGKSHTEYRFLDNSSITDKWRDGSSRHYFPAWGGRMGSQLLG